jgi:glycosyltransferase involved in cell wall biosynthesis
MTRRRIGLGGSGAAPIRVLHLLGSSQPEATSLAQTVRVLASSPRIGYELTAWFTGEDGPGPLLDELRELGIDAKMRPWAGFRDMQDVANSICLARDLRRGRFEIVHRHVGGRALPWIVRISCRAQVVSQASRIAAEDGGFAPLNSYRSFETVFAVSQAVANTVGAQTRVVNLGTRIPRVPPRFGPLVIGAAGRLVRGKGRHYLLKAFALLRSEYPDSTLEIAGEGQEREALENQANRLGLKSEVRFLGWQSNMAEKYAR